MALTTINRPDDQKALFGTGNDLEIYHSGTYNRSYINATGTNHDLTIAADEIVLGNSAMSEALAKFTADGAVELYHNNIKTFETQANGITVLGPEGGDAEVRLKADEGDDNADLWRINADTGGVFQIQNYTAGSWEANIECNGNGNVELLYDNSIKLETFSGGCKVYSDLSVRGIEGGDAVLSLVSDEGDDNGDNWRLITTASAENFSIQNWNGSSWETNVQLAHNGHARLYYNGGQALETNDQGVKITGAENGNGVIYLYADEGDDNADKWAIVADAAASNFIVQNFAQGQWEKSIECQGDGNVELFYDNNKKFETGSNGTITWGTAYHEAGGIMATYAHTGTGESVRFRANTGTVVGNITVGASSTAFNTSSDYRLKENQVSISDGITRLKTLKPYRFNFKVEPSKTVDGFFAHEVTAVPEAITGEKDASEMQQIDQSKLVPLLTAALQEAITKIETLETKVAALEAA